MKVLVTGGTGLVGSVVVERLLERGDEVVLITRRSAPGRTPAANLKIVTGDINRPGPWLDELNAIDAVIHLAGTPIAGKRWSTAYKQSILDSRVDSTRLIAEALGRLPGKVLINASAIGYYGNYTNNPTEFVEGDLPGSGYLPDVCVAWEQATQPALASGTRVALIRIGIVLAKTDGAYPKMAKPFRLFAGGTIASGKQWLSWIHLNDVVGIILFALDRNLSGPINAVAPEAITQWGFSRTLGKALRRPCWLPVPGFALRLLLGEQAILATHGQRVVPRAATQAGYEWQYPELEEAIRQLENHESQS